MAKLQCERPTQEINALKVSRRVLFGVQKAVILISVAILSLAAHMVAYATHHIGECEDPKDRISNTEVGFRISVNPCAEGNDSEVVLKQCRDAYKLVTKECKDFCEEQIDPNDQSQVCTSFIMNVETTNKNCTASVISCDSFAIFPEFCQPGLSLPLERGSCTKMATCDCRSAASAARAEELWP